MTFDDLIFHPHPVLGSGIKAQAFFANGFGLSVVQGTYSYGGSEGLYEIHLLRGQADNFVPCEAPTSSVLGSQPIGYLSSWEVTAFLKEVELLAPCTGGQPS